MDSQAKTCSFTPKYSSHKVLEANVAPRLGGEDAESDAASGTDCCESVTQFMATAQISNQKQANHHGQQSRTLGPEHLLTLRGLASCHSLASFVAKYLSEEVYGLQSANTLDAKSRDLTVFVTWFVAMNGTGEISHWMPRDTQIYLNHLEEKGRAATTINRVFATLRHFARWAHEQPGSVFETTGLPTRGIKELAVDEPDCQKLDKRDVHRLFKAAERLVLTETRKNQRPRRNLAILALLYYTGLRVSELVALRRHQYDGRYLINVKRKGKARSKGLYVSAECRRLLDLYLDNERGRDAESVGAPAQTAAQHGGALITASGLNTPLTRRMVAKILDRIAEETNKHEGIEKLNIHPHCLRHTFGAEYRERTGSDTETAAALGHTGLEYVGRYVRKTQKEREEIIDCL